MPIAFFCPHCGKDHVVRSRHAGIAAQCSCGRTIDVPLASEPPPLPAWSTPALPVAMPVERTPPAVAWPVDRRGPAIPWWTVAGIAFGSAIIAALAVVAVVLPTRSSVAPAVAAAPTPTPAIPNRPTVTPPPKPTRSAAIDRSLADAMSTLGPGSAAQGFQPIPHPGFTPPPPVATTMPREARRAWPADAEWTTPTPGIREMRLTVDSASGQKTQLRVYLPADQVPGTKLPCVFIAPAGSRLYHGMDLVAADAAEHWPYVRAGFAVIAYSLSGPLADADANDPIAVKRAFDEFARSFDGLFNARAAMDYAAARRPEIDRDRFFVAGHSSAGTVALQVAARDFRVRACCAYAPVVDFKAHFADTAATLEKSIFSFELRMQMFSPITLPKPRGPVLLFRAEDDATVSADALQRYVERIGARLVTVPTGGHYQSMIDRGIPAGIEFLKRVDASPKARRP